MNVSQGPMPAPRPRTHIDLAKFDEFIAILQRWRNLDHEDRINLHRNEIIRILDGVEELRSRI